MNATRITYWIRISDSAYVESSPVEIQEFMAQGSTLDIRISVAVSQPFTLY